MSVAVTTSSPSRFFYTELRSQIAVVLKTHRAHASHDRRITAGDDLHDRRVTVAGAAVQIIRD